MGSLIHPDGTFATLESVTALLVSEKISCNHVRDAAGTKGQSIHTWAQGYAETGEIPDVSQFPEEDRGYLQGFARWVINDNPKFIRTEVVVGSKEHGFTGRYDVDCEIKGELWRLDYKSSKGIYDSFLLQTEAYQGAAIEMGYPAADVRAVLRLGSDGSYELVRSTATYEQFLAIKSAYDALQALKASQKVAA